MEKKSKHLICIVGPTASGKTAIGIELAKHFDTEILSADSRQMYRQMKIGTAKPSIEELSQATHHFIDNINLWDDYSAGDFEREGIELLSNLFKSKDEVILVGGSGLFVKALTEGFDYIPKVSPETREELNQKLETEGLLHLQNLLKEKDPIQYEEMDINNPQRVIRALEVCIETGEPYSSFKGQKKNNRAFSTIIIGLEWERESLYERINTRVDRMIEDGLQQEVNGLLQYCDHSAFNTVGYKEFIPYFNKESTINQVVEKIKINTRRYAKRQLTWFKKTSGIIWVKPETPLITTEIENILKN